MDHLTGSNQVNDGSIQVNYGPIQVNDGSIQVNGGSIQVNDGPNQSHKLIVGTFTCVKGCQMLLGTWRYRLGIKYVPQQV